MYGYMHRNVLCAPLSNLMHSNAFGSMVNAFQLQLYICNYISYYYYSEYGMNIGTFNHGPMGKVYTLYIHSSLPLLFFFEFHFGTKRFQTDLGFKNP